MEMRKGLILSAWLKELVEDQVILDDGIALLDTTIIATRGVKLGKLAVLHTHVARP
jgi:hypothetical protein